ncbi:diaminohydroxyphosphoribosylaminopyrimidine deaminase [Polaribacter sp. KT25b]|uniref:bifunctional diaminohydroxyphosphoribosylaminopyrimidine deaminase/5-amino-6-(5-phosphoribosylamino)uracil reductase RibD n=1 Tax=Polaribacter sp. KT25b TaxID=1855336 RepID=UPI00087CF036|nr:bifunctional diaminohydroxyphosphoribosylaminopyrimidine deaminase/5-amino-6-(5-phosphoribosylamino)uracil reductase RibD [Polaribacter sp. KT25b]SDR80054.1 diaminohydroxyphosphoribosylaminopyrimidine deaminase [Polaribacter sp. KT25b]
MHIIKNEFYIKRCLQIAKNGIGSARPNPSVGAVIVYQNKIIGEGFTSNYGGNHAEVNAVNSVKDKALLKEATIYVTLEPCSHFGKTPPCADLLVKHKFKNVVIGCVDSNSLVAGKGIERLKNAGINVIVGVLEAECKEHHKRFFTVQEKKRPFIILKWAETTNGFIAPLKRNLQAPVWISNNYSQQLVHKFRSEEHAILVGTNTVIADNPKLNVRSWFGNNPIRVVLDKNLRIPKEMNVFDGSVKTIVITEKENCHCEQCEAICFETIDFSKNVAKQIVAVLQKHQIQSVIIEGGTQTLQTFIDANLWDEAKVFTGESSFKNGIKAPVFSAQITSETRIKNDILKIYEND